MESRQSRSDPRETASYDSQGKKKSFRRLFTRFAEKTSMQGVPYINMAKFWWAKLIWVILLLCALVAMSLHLWYLFDQYFTWPVNTKVSLGFQTLSFPQVTICNTNILHKTRFANYNGSQELKWLVWDLEPEHLFESETTTTTPTTDQTSGPTQPTIKKRRKRYIDEYNNFNISKYDPEYRNYEDEYLDDEDDYTSPLDSSTEIRDLFTDLYMDIYREDRDVLGHQMADMLVSCTFNGRQCTPDQFELHQTSEYGNCWTLHDRKFRVKKAGPLTGLSLTLFLETQEYLKGVTNGYGVRLAIQEPNTYPFPADKGLFIPASMETDIGMKLINITRLSGNYGSCNDGSEFRRLYNMTYTRRACQSFCQMSTVMKKCSCFDDYWEEFAFTRDSTLRPCRSEKEEKCLLEISNSYYNGSLTCTCENPCSEASYTRAISQRQWPTEEYARVLVEWICDSDETICESLTRSLDLDDVWTLNNNFMKLNIYYEDLNFEDIKETAEIEIQQFLSDVGGAIGLWIGLSILSMCELFQLIAELCNYGYHKSTYARKSRRQRRESSDRGERNAGSYNDRPPFVFNKGDNPYKERSGYHSDDERYSHRRYRDPNNKYGVPRDRHIHPRDLYIDSRNHYRDF